MIEQYAHALAHYLQSNPNMGGLITFLIAFLESLAVVGTIIPGSITMSAIGVLVGTGILPMGLTLFWAVLGAFLGDLLGYGIGWYYNERLRSMWPFKNRPKWLEVGKTFFHKHGGKSIYIGRFVGPLRSVLPLIAGILHMPWQRFVLAALPASALWAIVYMLPGFLIGAVSLQLPPKMATKFILVLFLVILIASLFAWLFKILYVRLIITYRSMIKRVWHRLEKSHYFAFIPDYIRTNVEDVDYNQLSLLLLAISFSLLFIIIFLSVISQNILISLNRPIFELLRTLRHAASDRVFIGITLFGDGKILLLSGTIIFFWLAYKKYSREAYYWLMSLAISVGIPLFYKFFFYFPRPSGLLHASSASSFPSGHTFQALMFFGFLATMIATHLHVRYRHYLYYLTTLIVFLVGFSRLYLGAHWLTDVFASISLGLTCLTLLTLCYRRKVAAINVTQLALVACTTFLIIWTSVFTFNYQRYVVRYSILFPSKTIAMNSWWNQLNQALPIYRQNRFGKPSEPMNIQYAGDIQQLKALLASKGWRSSPDVTLIKSTLQKLVHTPNNFNTLLPSLYLNHPPILFMIKDEPEGKLIIRLWDSNVYFAQTWDPLYVGNIVEYQMDPDKETIIYSFNVTEKLAPYLNKNNWHVNEMVLTNLPFALIKKNWEGKVLQINAPAFY